MKKIVTQEQKEIVLLGSKVGYTLKVSNRVRTMKLAVYHDGNFVVTVPRRIHESIIANFIVQKALWIIEKIEYFKNNPRPKAVVHSASEIAEYKKQAKKILEERLPHFSTYYGVTYKNVVVKNITSRWGSCSSKGNLNFNYKIATLTPELSDYIIVHELCHLKEMNHSRNFWNLVEKQIPHHRELRKQLKLYK